MSKLIVTLVLISHAYSIDIFLDSQRTVFSGSSYASLFGYSLLLHGDNTKGSHQSSNKSCLLRVGAPKTMNTNGNQAGAIFQCNTQNLPLNGSVVCIEDHLNTDTRIGRSAFNTDDIWYGATIAAVTPDTYVACAPRMTKLHPSNNHPSHKLMFGGCVIKAGSGTQNTLYPFFAQNSLVFTVDGSRKDYEPNSSYFYYAFAEAGMSLKVANDNSIIIGAPGVLQWTGGVAEYSVTCNESVCHSQQKQFVNPFYINEVKPDEYLGYSVESGILDNSGKTLYVVGAPRSGAGYGKVLIFEPLTFYVKGELIGPQLGSYFGATLLCADVNGDDMLDILVGAPNHVSTEEHLTFDQGAVFVYMNHNLLLQRTPTKLTGSGASGARFGSALANLGDIDSDGYNDIAIGAPWADNGDSGAVYIYKGGRYGLEDKFSQKITAEGSNSFGFSISNAFDVDLNYCGDFAVGAPNSNKVYLYKCVPTIVVKAQIDVDNVLDLPQNATNFTAQFRVSSLPHRNNVQVKLHLNAKITVTSNNNEATLLGDSEYSIVIKSEDYHIHEQIIQVKPNANLSKPITIHFKVEENSELASKDPERFGRVSENSELYATNDVKLLRDCGSDLQCIPLLTLKITPSVREYIPGNGQILGVNITVFNKAEPAYDAKVYIPLPLLPKRVPNGCSLTNDVMICNVLSPLNRLKSDTWELEFEYDSFPSNSKRNLIINASVEQINTAEKIYKECIIQVSPESEISVIGNTFPNKTISVSREDLNNNANISFTHVFQMRNLGPSDYYDLFGSITHPDMVEATYLTNNIENGIKKELPGVTMFRKFYFPANTTLTLTTKLTFNLAQYGADLVEHTNLTFSSIIKLPEVYRKGFLLPDINATVTTKLILEPASPLWPIIVGLVGGLLVLAVIVFAFNKCGFFSRPSHENLKKLKQEKSSSTEETEPSSSNVLALNEYESSQLICVSDSDDEKGNDNVQTLK